MTFLQALDITSFLAGMLLGVFCTVAVFWLELEHLKRKFRDAALKGDLK